MSSTKPFRGRAIYQPSGAAGEYSQWACNLFNGCSNRCDYCYNRHSMTAKVLGADDVTMKASLTDDYTAKNYYLRVFAQELDANLEAIKRDGGLFFSFVSDPLLEKTYGPNLQCMEYAVSQGVHCTVLTKSAWWIGTNALSAYCVKLSLIESLKDNLSLGFTLTGKDYMERHCTNDTFERIHAMHWAQENGIHTWASIEPVITYANALSVIILSLPYCKEYRIGLASKLGIKYDPASVLRFKQCVETTVGDKAKIVWKKSVLDKIK